MHNDQAVDNALTDHPADALRKLSENCTAAAILELGAQPATPALKLYDLFRPHSSDSSNANRLAQIAYQRLDHHGITSIEALLECSAAPDAKRRGVRCLFDADGAPIPGFSVRTTDTVITRLERAGYTLRGR